MASVRVFHQDGSDDDVRSGFARFGGLVTFQLAELEQGFLVEFDASLQDAQEEVQRVVGQSRLDDIQQRLVFNESLLDFRLLQRQKALMRGGDRSRPV